MRRGYDFVERKKRMICGRRFLLENVQSCACYPFGFDCFIKSALVNKATASAVDDTHTALHLPESFRAYKTACFGCERRMNGYEVCAREYFIERNNLKFKVSRLFGSDERIVSDDVHSERASAAGNNAAYATESYDPQNFALKLNAYEFFSFPIPRL